VCACSGEYFGPACDLGAIEPFGVLLSRRRFADFFPFALLPADVTNPQVTSGVTAPSSLSNVSPTLGWLVSFSEPVLGLTAASFDLSLSTAPAAAVISVSPANGDGSAWTVGAVARDAGSIVVRVNSVGSGVTDETGNPLVAFGAAAILQYGEHNALSCPNRRCAHRLHLQCRATPRAQPASIATPAPRAPLRAFCAARPAATQAVPLAPSATPCARSAPHAMRRWLSVQALAATLVARPALAPHSTSALPALTTSS
jgi:hypothetical protein